MNLSSLLYFVSFFISLNISAVEVTDRKLGKTFIYYSDTLQSERVIDIYVPEPAAFSSTPLPTLYLLDSNEIFDQVVALVKHRWQRGIGPQMIIVGVQARNASERFEHAVPIQQLNSDSVIFEAGKPYIMQRFFKNDLIPFINANYPTNHYKVVAGISPTATNVMHDYLSANPIFNAHIAMAADFLATNSFNKNKKQTLLEEIALHSEKHKQRFLFVSLASQDAKENQQLAAPLKNIANSTLYKKRGVHAFIPENSEHYSHVGSAIQRAFSLLFPLPIWQLKYDKIMNKGVDPADFIIDFYTNLDNFYRFTTRPYLQGYWTINSTLSVVERLMSESRWADSNKLLLWLITRIDKDPQLYYLLAYTQYKRGQIVGASRSASKAVMLANCLGHDEQNKFSQFLLKLESL